MSLMLCPVLSVQKEYLVFPCGSFCSEFWSLLCWRKLHHRHSRWTGCCQCAWPQDDSWGWWSDQTCTLVHTLHTECQNHSHFSQSYFAEVPHTFAFLNSFVLVKNNFWKVKQCISFNATIMVKTLFVYCHMLSQSCSWMLLYTTKLTSILHSL